MFAQFSERLYSRAVDNEYRLMSANGEEISSATHWVAQKIEMATVVTIHVIDATRVDFGWLINYDKKNRAGAESFLRQVGQMANVYVLAGGVPPNFDGVEEYFGQPVYSIFWHANLETGEISVPKGQPKKTFGIREMVLAAYNESKVATCVGAESSTFSEITKRVDALRPKAKYRYPIISIFTILINVVILGLMYLDGYRAGDIFVPVRFGAIAPYLVIYNNEWHRLFAAMFLHFGIAHLFANSMGILIFGTRLERYLGRRMFCAVYVFSGLLGSAFSLVNLYFFHPYTVSAGASGAVYGIVGAIFAYTRITKRSIEFINWYIMLIFIGIGMVMGFATPGIDNLAHIGGLLGGVLLGGIYAMRKKPNHNVV